MSDPKKEEPKEEGSKGKAAKKEAAREKKPSPPMTRESLEALRTKLLKKFH